MDGYPLNLVLAVTTASATIFLGYLPIKTVHASFFARETLKAAVAWGLVALLSPTSILHYPILLAILCLIARHQFSEGRAFSGKLWLVFAAGLGISIGVMLILAVTPRAYPPELTEWGDILLLASIYLGGAVIGAAYVGYIMSKNVSTNSGIAQGQVQRYVKLLLGLVLARMATILGTFFLIPGHYESKTFVPATSTLPGTLSDISVIYVINTVSVLDLAALGLAILVIPVLALRAERNARFSSRIQPTRMLAAVCIVGFVTEVIARLLVI